MENYGYKIIDLGRDVAIEKVVKAVIEEEVGLVGLSALMTTTLPSMKENYRKGQRSFSEYQGMGRRSGTYRGLCL